MSLTVNSSDPLKTQKSLPPLPQKQRSESDYESLIPPGIKHVLAVKLNNLTGGKFKCFRNWEESSGQALFNAIKKVYGRKVVDATLKTIEDKVNPVLKNTQAWLGGNGRILQKVTESVGVDQSVKVCRKFTEVSCLLLKQGEEGTTQNIDRLLTVVGVAYSGNENVKAIVDSILESYSRNFFEEVLPKMIRDLCGKFGGPVEALVVILGAKDIVVNFLKKWLLQDQNVEKVLQKGDVYQKLILMCIAKFFDINDQRVQDLKVQDLLADERLDKRVRAQLKRLLRYYSDSKLTQLGTKVGHFFIKRTLERLKNKDIGEISSEELKEGLIDAVTFDGAYNRAVEVTSVATEIGNFVKDTYIVKKVRGVVRFAESFFTGEKTEKKIEDDFSEYLQELFEERVVEQKEEQSTSVWSAVAEDAITVGKGTWKMGKAVVKGSAKVVEVTAPVVGNALVGTGKVAWWSLKFGGKALLGTVKLLGRGAIAAYNSVASSSAEPEPGKVAPKAEVDVSKGIAPESQTAQAQKKSDVKAVEERS